MTPHASTSFHIEDLTGHVRDSARTVGGCVGPSSLLSLVLGFPPKIYEDIKSIPIALPSPLERRTFLLDTVLSLRMSTLLLLFLRTLYVM